MLFDLPSDETLYHALLNRDPAYEGRAYVGVATTGIFCRLTCPARKPKRANCAFYNDVAACINAGFRPCKRCHPLGTTSPDIAHLLNALDANPHYRWAESDIIAQGYDPSTMRRSFKRQFGMTFLEMARQRRLVHGFSSLGHGKVIDAQLNAGFDSPSAFRAAFARLTGRTPNSFTSDAFLRASYIPTPLGDMIAVCDKRTLHLLEFADRKALPGELKKLENIGIGRFDSTDLLQIQLNSYFIGKSDNFTIPLTLHGTPFARDVWRALRKIPAGETRSYSALARQIGAPNATRAVAQANGANQIALIIPCHRVIGANGALTGYGGGLWRKQKLIALEKHYAQRKIS